MMDGSNIMAGRFSLLELFHPDGSANTSLVLGSNCPDLFQPEPPVAPGQHAELFILAPTPGECSTGGWLEAATYVLACQLAADGVGYILAPRRWRFKITRLLHRHGLLLELPIGHIPDWASSPYLVPLTTTPAHYAFSTLLSMPSWKGNLAGLWIGLPGATQVLSYLGPSVGLIFRRPGARPLFKWLFTLGAKSGRPGRVIMRTNWRGQDGAVVLYRFSQSDTQPAAVAKVAPVMTSAANHVREAMALSHLGAGACSAGARVPRVLLLAQKGNYSVLLQSTIFGRPAAELLSSQPSQLASFIERLVSWLENWHRATLVVRPLDEIKLHRTLLVPVTQLAPLLEQGEEYCHWLSRRCHAATDASMPLVATHNDLTMANVLFDEDNTLGIVDWETGREDGFPLVDFFYALTDAVMVSRGDRNRLEAFKACFAPGGVHTATAARLQAHLASVIGVPAAIIKLCFHACWLHHAINEHHTSRSADARPFLSIVQWLALHHSISEEDHAQAF